MLIFVQIADDLMVDPAARTVGLTPTLSARSTPKPEHFLGPHPWFGP
jgi:hypothetical protein